MQKCHDCGVEEGQVHQYGCDMERCPFCGRQLISCSCMYEKLGLVDKKKCTSETSYLPPKVYSEGLSDEQEKQWIKILEAAGRVPYIMYPNMCARCGQLWPNVFKISDEEWNTYVERSQRHKILCKKCYNKIKQLIDKHKIQKEGVK